MNKKIFMLRLFHSFDFATGVKIRSGEIRHWHEQAIKYFEDNPGGEVFIHASGNSIVIAIKRREKEDEKGVRLYEITNGYKIFEYELLSDEAKPEVSDTTMPLWKPKVGPQNSPMIDRGKGF